jgi:hypothetical protein
LEYLTAEGIELSGNQAKMDKKARVTLNYICKAIIEDYELKEMCGYDVDKNPKNLQRKNFFEASFRDIHEVNKELAEERASGKVDSIGVGGTQIDDGPHDDYQIEDSVYEFSESEKEEENQEVDEESDDSSEDLESERSEIQTNFKSSLQILKNSLDLMKANAPGLFKNSEDVLNFV